MKQFLLNNKIKYHLVPPHLHIINAAERTIQTFKAKFITCLCKADPKYPAKEWYRFVLQENLTQNLLRKCRFNPKLSAHAALHVKFDYKKTPLAPLGTRIRVHEKTTNRHTWSLCGTNGWYIGPALEHYQCVECYIPSTNSTIIADTVELISTFIPIPKTI